MKCPRCENTVLVISDRQGVEIDHCPSCRGVWLDRGELDKLIERVERYDADAYARQRPPEREHYSREQPSRDHYPQRKKSFWQEMFD